MAGGGLVVCGLLTAGAIVACICLDETLGFNMLMCVFCVVAIVRLWTEDKNRKVSIDQFKDNEDKNENTDKML